MAICGGATLPSARSISTRRIDFFLLDGDGVAVDRYKSVSTRLDVTDNCLFGLTGCTGFSSTLQPIMMPIRLISALFLLLSFGNPNRFIRFGQSETFFKFCPCPLLLHDTRSQFSCAQRETDRHHDLQQFGQEDGRRRVEARRLLPRDVKCQAQHREVQSQGHQR